LKATGIPGHKLEMTKKEIDSIHEEIFKYDWSAIKPQIEDFRKADEEKLKTFPETKNMWLSCFV
jgi:hypothetical protein